MFDLTTFFNVDKCNPEYFGFDRECVKTSCEIKGNRLKIVPPTKFFQTFKPYDQLAECEYDINILFGKVCKIGPDIVELPDIKPNGFCEKGMCNNPSLA